MNTKLHIEIETVTPIYTGDAFSVMSIIEPQSIMGSLRFWFDTYLMAVNLFKNECTELNLKSYKAKIEEAVIEDGEPLKEAVILSRHAQELPMSSYIFGCNSLGPLISIEKIQILNDVFRQFQSELSKNTFHKAFKYWPEKYFSGSFSIDFNLKEKNLKKTIILPLLNFIEHYGYLGAKNKFGFGRVKFKFVDNTTNIEHYTRFNFSEFINSNNSYSIHGALSKVNSFKELYIDNKIGLYKISEKPNDKNKEYIIIELLKKLSIEKAKQRRFINEMENKNEELFNYVYGNTSNWRQAANGSKILPWINQKNNIYEYGFISVVLLDRTKLRRIQRLAKT